MCKENSFKILQQIKKLKRQDENYVISDRFNDFKDEKSWNNYVTNLQYIFVGDNPGNMEKSDGVYFSPNGHTGQNIRKFINNYFGFYLNTKNDFNEILFLNKSLKSTATTADLTLDIVKNDTSQILTAKLINAISKENDKVFICILGTDSFESDIFSIFFNKIKSFKQNIGLYFHPSRRHPITLAEQEKLKSKDVLSKCKIEFFKFYGQEMYRLARETKNKNFEEILKKFAETIEK